MPNQWLPSTLRVSTFFEATLAKEHHPDIEAVFSLEVESTVTRGPNKDLMQIASMGLGKLNLSAAGQRVDWIWTTQASESKELGEYESSLAAFLGPIQTWLAAQKGITRIALGGIFVIPADDRESGYVKLQEFLGAVQLDPKNSSEFIYQINRPKPGQIRGETLSFNLISKWAVSATQFTEMIMTPTGFVPGPGSAQTFACSCELDLSTPVVHPFIFSGPEATEVIAELSAHCDRILIEGDHA